MLIVRIKQCEAALAGGRLDEAVELLGRPAIRAHRRGQELVDATAAALLRRGREHLAAGRVGPADQDCRKLAALAGNTVDVAALRVEVDQARVGEWQRVRREGRALAVAARVGDRRGPLALPHVAGENGGMASPVGRRFVLHVDGAGSFLVVQGDPCYVGPVSASRAPEVPLLTAAGTPGVTLSRSEDDYLLSAHSAVMLNGVTTTRALLNDGDRLGLGPRCRIEFRRPNPASASALLRLSGARMPWGAVREVVLMGRELVIGPASTAHVRTRDTSAQVVLHAEDGRLLCRASEGLRIDGVAAANDVELGAGMQVMAGTTGFAIQQIG